MEKEQIECSETSAHRIQRPRNHPKERIRHSEHGESLKSGMKMLADFEPNKIHKKSYWRYTLFGKVHEMKP
jgi:hypothetical protein